MDVPARRTADRFDFQTATNYFGPFVLTNLLADRITDRVVNVTSQLHRRAKLDLGDLDWRTRVYNPMQAYCDSKLAITLFSLELERFLLGARAATDRGGQPGPVGPVRWFLFSALISATSPPDSSKSKMAKFSLTRDGVTDFGKMMSPRWMCQRSTTWPGSGRRAPRSSR
jgi:NAD(P)-dependent dehydrogenase (short-subunit alcohol dehydrogenase family)